MKDETILVGIVGIIGLAGVLYFFTRPAEGHPSEGTLDIISCTPNVNISKGDSAFVYINVKAINNNISKDLKLTTSDGSYSDIKSVSLNKDETTTLSFEIPFVNNTINYIVEVI